MLDEEGRLAYQADCKVDMVSYGEYDFEHDFVLAGIHRWDGLRDPFLYTIRMELFQDRRILDIAETKIGYRSLELDRERGLLLNGRPCPLHGSILEGLVFLNILGSSRNNLKNPFHCCRIDFITGSFE